jgi:glycyl-tRNA synthetase beta chain
MADLLFEIFSEEIPARMQAKALDDLTKFLTEGLQKNGLTFGAVRGYVTPRRIAVVVADVPDAQPDVSEERKGPKADAPEKAIAGFLKSVGLTRDQVEERETPKGNVLFAVIERKGQPSVAVIKTILEDALAAFPWPKSMRWGANTTRWVRPLHTLLCVFDGAVIPVEFAGVTAGNSTRGHRFMAPDAFPVANEAEYLDKLRAAKVEPDAAVRRARIETQIAALMAAHGLTLQSDEGLMREVTGLVEWPIAMLGTIDAQFMDVPAEVLSTAMKAHQKYFSVLTADGKMAPHFVVIANMETADNGAQIIAGNEKVLRARLSDAKFFWDQDRKAKLESRLHKLDDRIFHAKMGTDGQKVARMRALAGYLAPFVSGANTDKVDLATRLAKADLVTEMVYEFPELQGLMGRYYALHDGLDAQVADAIASHYAPQGPSDACPTDPVAICVALADKLDTLVGFWLVDEKPTGSKDPFSLRRAALGVIRLIVENNLRLPLHDVLGVARKLYLDQGHAAIDAAVAARAEKAELADLMDFIAERLKVSLKEKGVRHDLISAVFALGGEDDLVRVLARVAALAGFLSSDDGQNLMAAYRRAANIVRIERKKDGEALSGAPDAALFAQEQEKNLFACLQDVVDGVKTALKTEEFEQAMQHLARLRAPVDAFFDDVTVNAEDQGLRANRLRLLTFIEDAMGTVADFSKIEG